MADDAGPLDLRTDHEAGHVGQEDERHVERVAQPDEPRRLVGRVDEQHSPEMLRVVRDDPDRHAVEPREPDDQLPRPQRLQLEERVVVDERVEHLVHVVRAPFLDRHDLGDRRRVGDRRDRVRQRRRLQPVRRQVREEPAGLRDRVLVGRAEIVAAAADGGVHARPAHLVERDVLADHDLGHAGRAEVHRRVALDHEHDVAERGNVRTARGRRTEQATHLRHLARQAHLVREDAARAPAPGKQVDLVGDARAGGVDEIHHRQLVTQRVLGEPHDLLDGARTPRTRLHRGVVRHHAHRPTVDAARHP